MIYSRWSDACGKWRRFIDRIKTTPPLKGLSVGQVQDLLTWKEELGPVIQRIRLTFYTFRRLMEAIFRRDHPGSGRFSDDLSFNSQAFPPAMAEAEDRISVVRHARSQSFFRSLSIKVCGCCAREGMLPTLPARTKTASQVDLAKLAGPMRSGEECCEKSTP